MARNTDSGHLDPTSSPETHTGGPAPDRPRTAAGAPRQMVPLMDPDTGLPFVDEFGVVSGGRTEAEKAHGTAAKSVRPTPPEDGAARTRDGGWPQGDHDADRAPRAPEDEDAPTVEEPQAGHRADAVPPTDRAVPAPAGPSGGTTGPAAMPWPLVTPPQAAAAPARPAAGLVAAGELLDTGERAVLSDALDVVDGGSRVAAPPTATAAPVTAAPARSAPTTWSDADEDGAQGPSGHDDHEDHDDHYASDGRRAPWEDPDLVEERGPSSSGWLALFAGALAAAACGTLLWWHGVLPEQAVRLLHLPARHRAGLRLRDCALLALGGAAVLYALVGLARGRVGRAWVLSRFGSYRGTVRRTGLVWIDPLLRRRRMDVRLRHWRSEPMSAVDAAGVQLRVVILVVWQVADAARARYMVDDHVAYLREQVEASTARVLGRLPADAFHDDTPSLRNAEAVGDALTAQLAADCRPVGIEVFSAQPTRIEYAPEVAAAMHRRQIAAIDARHRESVLSSVVDAVDDTVRRLTSRGLVDLDDYERKALVKDLTVAFYTARGGAATKE